MKNLLKLFLTFIFVLSCFCFLTVEANNIRVTLDGQTLYFSTPPQIINGRTMVPMRRIFEEMGTKVAWDNATQTITATNEICIIKATIDNNILMINGTPKVLDVPPKLINGNTMVPARFIAEALGATVQWDTLSSTVIIKSPQANTNANEKTGSDQYVAQYMYTADGRMKKVPDFYIDVYKKACWYTYPVQVLYAPDGTFKTVKKTEISKYESAGWSTIPFVKMYAPDGRTIVVSQKEVAAYKKVGWYTEHVVIMYAPDGRTLPVVDSEIEAHKKVGWYSVPVVTMYAINGKTIVVAKSEINAYKKSGWYETLAAAQKARKLAEKPVHTQSTQQQP